MKKFLLYLLVSACLANVTFAHEKTSSIMVDAKSGDILYQKNADIQRYPASLTKLMTLYITFNALENGNLSMNDKLKVSHTAAGRSPSKLGLNAGETIDVRTCILASIIKSANDCATVLGEALAGGNEREFAKMMTKTAQKLGMKNTVFKNASGLNHSEQKTTARDMAILGLAIYHHFPKYYPLFSMTEFEYNGQKIEGHNELLKTYEGTDGMKTGYTATAGFNIVTSAQRDSHRIIVVEMGHQKAQERDEKVASMLDEVFDSLQKYAALDIQKLKANIEIPKGGQKKQISTYAYATQATEKPKDDYAIKIGAFSSYDKALAHAQNVQKQYASKLLAQNIRVDKLVSKNKTLYRAQIIGIAQSDASKLCTALKNKKQDCVAVLFKSDTMFAQGSR